MHWSPLIEQALIIAAKSHEGQYRKGPEQLPYITHPVAVASILSAYTTDEDVIAAALLHDVLEDTVYTEDMMRAEFGDRITSIVKGVTIPSQQGAWAQDRRAYIINLTLGSTESAMIAAADKLHNFLSTLADFGQNAEEYKRAFTGTPEDRIVVYGAIVKILAGRIPLPFAERLIEVWKRYEAFLQTLT